MRIESITLRKLKMRLKSPFETSFGTAHDRTVVLVELLADGLTGWSEVTAWEGPFFNSETVDTAWLVIRGFLVPLVLGREVGSAEEIPHIFAAIRGHEMARAGIENALWDVEAQQKKRPLTQLLGGTQTELKCGVSLGLQATPEVLLGKIAVELRAGYQRINQTQDQTRYGPRRCERRPQRASRYSSVRRCQFRIHDCGFGPSEAFR